VAVLGSNSAGKTTLMNTASASSWTWRRRKRRGGLKITVMGELRYEERRSFTSNRVPESGKGSCSARRGILFFATVTFMRT